MLNSDEGIGRNKFIIVGVTNEKKLKGISKETWRDDNEWQNLLKKITPRPHVSTGMVLFDGRLYGYIFIDKSNKDFVYEVKETVTNEKSGSLSNKTNSARKVKGVYIGQAFTRYGSQNSIMFNEDRKKLMNRIVYQSPDVGLFNNYIRKEKVKKRLSAPEKTSGAPVFSAFDEEWVSDPDILLLR